MLVVTRKINEAFLLGEDVKIVVLDIDSERVKIRHRSTTIIENPAC